MAIKQFKPTSPGRRGATGPSFDEITRSRPEKSLLKPKKRTGGRNNQGRLTVRHRGGGAKRRLRIIDFKRDKYGVPGRVASIEYDPKPLRPHRPDPLRRWREAIHHMSRRLSVNDNVMSGPEAEIKPGNALPLKKHPLRHHDP